MIAGQSDKSTALVPIFGCYFALHMIIISNIKLIEKDQGNNQNIMLL